jgi:hypothetical protein
MSLEKCSLKSKKWIFKIEKMQEESATEVEEDEDNTKPFLKKGYFFKEFIMVDYWNMMLFATGLLCAWASIQGIE